MMAREAPNANEVASFAIGPQAMSTAVVVYMIRCIYPLEIVIKVFGVVTDAEEELEGKGREVRDSEEILCGLRFIGRLVSHASCGAIFFESECSPRSIKVNRGSAALKLQKLLNVKTTM